jgi:2-phospho-L-lactate guanylyltransferase
MIAALVPVKRLDTAKSRLLPELPRADVERLTLAMLGDVLEPLLASPRLAAVAVVTEDTAVARAAEAAGARALLRPEPGLNAALDAGAAELAREGARAVLVVLGDVAGVTASDVDALVTALEAQGARGAVLAPSRDGGTGALLRAPYDAIPSRFGAQSAAAHRDAARTAGVPWRELDLPGLAVDLDRAEDVTEFLRAGIGGARTRRLLRELGWSGTC